MIYFRKPLEGIDRPQMEADVTIIGGGPAGMACALRLAQLIDSHNRRFPNQAISKENIYLLEKAREAGQHSLSGAVLDPRSMDELLPGWRYEAPMMPPPMMDHGNYVISINRFVKWMAEKVEQAGITVFTGFAGSDLVLDGKRVAGVRTDDKGIDKNGQKKSNFEPGYELKSKITVLAEGTRGSLTKQLVEKFDL